MRLDRSIDAAANMRRGKQYYIIITLKNMIFNNLYNMIYQLELLTSNLNQNWNYKIMRDFDINYINDY